MANFFAFKDIEKPVLLAGFVQVKSNAGSHQIYKQDKTGLMVTIPKHPAGVSAGVGEKVLEVAVLAARLLDINIGAKSNKHETNVANYILSHHAKCKKNPIFLIPEDIRKLKGIESVYDVKQYLFEQQRRFKQAKTTAQNKYTLSPA